MSDKILYKCRPVLCAIECESFRDLVVECTYHWISILTDICSECNVANVIVGEHVNEVSYHISGFFSLFVFCFFFVTSHFLLFLKIKNGEGEGVAIPNSHFLDLLAGHCLVYEKKILTLTPPPSPLLGVIVLRCGHIGDIMKMHYCIGHTSLQMVYINVVSTFIRNISNLFHISFKILPIVNVNIINVQEESYIIYISFIFTFLTLIQVQGHI